jgi:cytosine/adenosine deaminase-related metal-dependent hydrolase
MNQEVRILGPRGMLDLAGHTLMPGLINAHDHLEFNLFPQLGRGPYGNAGDWARDIYHPERSPIREHLRVLKPVRLWWGGLKNLLSGVTTVCHHNPYEPEVFGPKFPVRVVRRFAWAHSLEFEPDLVARFRKAPPRYPFLVHCGEGTDARARKELRTLDGLGALDRRTVIIHGVALAPRQLDLIRRRGAALIWCPTSNLSMLGRTLSRATLRSETPIALGTDSAISAPVDLLDELKVARRYLPAGRLYEMVSAAPAKILRLQPHVVADDWVAVRSDAQSTIGALLSGSIALVVVRGSIRLIAPQLARQLPAGFLRKFQPLTIEGRPMVLVDADVRKLRQSAARHLGRVLKLAGRRILE